MTALPRNYDAWRLIGPYDDAPDYGTAFGEECNRCAEPDEDAPRGYKPRPCNGEMMDDGGIIVCDTCGERA